MPTATMRIQVATLSDVPDGESRSDGASGLEVTVTSIGAGLNHSLVIYSATDPVPPLLTPVGSTQWTFTPNAGAHTYALRLSVDDGAAPEITTRTYAIRTTNLGLRLPAPQERADTQASFQNNGPAVVEASWDNEGGNYWGWQPALDEALRAFDVLAGNAVQSGTAAGGDLGGTYPNPTVTDLTITGEEQGSVLYFNGANWVQLAPGVNGRVFTTHGAAANPTWEDAAGGVTDHGLLDAGSLLDDDHPQYALLAGRAGGQELIGGTDASDAATFRSTAHATRGPINFEALTTADADVEIFYRGGDSANQARLRFLYDASADALTFTAQEDTAGNNAFVDRATTLQLDGSQATLAAIGTDATLDLIGNRAAASTSADVRIRSTGTRTAGNLLRVLNNISSRFDIDFDGNVSLGRIGQVSDNDPRLTFHGGTGTVAATAYFQYDSGAGNGQLNAFLERPDNPGVFEQVLRLPANNGGIKVGSSGNTVTTEAIGIGWNHTASATRAIAIGRTASVQAADSIGIGPLCSIPSGAVRSIAIGRDSTVSTSDGTAIGHGTVIGAAHIYSVALGRSTITTAANQFVVGSNTGFITEMVIGGRPDGGDVARSAVWRVPGGQATVAGWNLRLQAGNGGSTSGDGGSLTLAGGTVTSGTPGSIVYETAGTSRLEIEGSGAWLVGGSAGTSGWVLTSNGAGAAPTWQAAPGGGSGGTLDQAYDFGGAGAGRIINVDTGAVALTYAPQGTAQVAFGIQYNAAVFTNDASGMSIDMTTATSIDTANDVSAINLFGRANDGAGSTIGLYVSGFDVAANFNSGAVRFNNQPGTSGQVLTSRGSALVPLWQDLLPLTLLQDVDSQVVLREATTNDIFLQAWTAIPLIIIGDTSNPVSTVSTGNSLILGLPSTATNNQIDVRYRTGDNTNQVEARNWLDTANEYAFRWRIRRDTAGDETFLAVPSVFEFGEGTTLDVDVEHRLSGGDGTNHVRYRTAFDASADTVTHWIEQDTAGNGTFVEASQVYNFGQPDTATKTTELRINSGNGSSNWPVRIITGLGNGSARILAPTNSSVGLLSFYNASDTTSILGLDPQNIHVVVGTSSSGARLRIGPGVANNQLDMQATANSWGLIVDKRSSENDVGPHIWIRGNIANNRDAALLFDVNTSELRWRTGIDVSTGEYKVAASTQFDNSADRLILGRDGSASAGGDSTLTAGNGVGTDQAGGNLLLNGGAATGIGLPGGIYLTVASTYGYGIDGDGTHLVTFENDVTFQTAGANHYLTLDDTNNLIAAGRVGFSTVIDLRTRDLTVGTKHYREISSTSANDTVTTIFTHTMSVGLASKVVYHFKASVSGVRASTIDKTSTHEIYGVFLIDSTSGAATVGTGTFHAALESGGATWLAVFTRSGNDVLLQVNGDASDGTIQWVAEIEWYSASDL